MTPLARGRAERAFEAHVGIEVAAGAIDRGEIQREEAELAGRHLQLPAHR